MAMKSVNAEVMDVCIQIRKLRKKLRQIEVLENQLSPLNEQEVAKVDKKTEIRAEVQRLGKVFERLKQTSLRPRPSSSDHSCNARRGEKTLVPSPSSQPDKDTLTDQTNTEYDKATTEHTTSSSPESDGRHPKRRRRRQKKTSSPKSDDAGVVEKHLTSSGCEEEEQNEAKEEPVTKDAGNKEPSQLSRLVSAVAPVVRRTDSVSSSDSTSQRHSMSVYWRRARFRITELGGHNDLITDVKLLARGKFIATACRDTTVKVFDCDTKEEFRQFCGHRGPVSSLAAVDWTPDLPGPGEAGATADDVLIISASSDCYLRVWSLMQGQQVREIYTFNPISKCQVVLLANPVSQKKQAFVISGSEAGKLELYDLLSGVQCYSSNVFPTQISAISVRYSQQLGGVLVAAASLDGLVKIFKTQVFSTSDESSLRIRLLPLFESEQLFDLHRRQVRVNNVRSIAWTDDDHILLVDSGSTIKYLKWRPATTSRLPNHTSTAGIGSAIGSAHLPDTPFVLVVSAAFELDTAHPMLHFREAVLTNRNDDNDNDDKDKNSNDDVDIKYRFSLSSKKCSSQITSLDLAFLSDSSACQPKLIVVTGGQQLLFWQLVSAAAATTTTAVAASTAGGQNLITTMRFRDMEAGQTGARSDSDGDVDVDSADDGDDGSAESTAETDGSSSDGGLSDQVDAGSGSGWRCVVV